MIETLLGHANTLLLLACSVGALAGGALMLVLRQPMRVAMALIATMLFLAGIYGLLGVHFIAAFQVLIYVGAVMLFMVYVIMLLEVREIGRRALLAPPAPGRRRASWCCSSSLAASVWRPLPSPRGEIGEIGYGIAAFSADFLGDVLAALRAHLRAAGRRGGGGAGGDPGRPPGRRGRTHG